LNVLAEEENPSLDDSLESDDRQMLLDDYVISQHCDVTEAHELEIRALVENIQPEIPVLVALMKKSNVMQHRRLVR
jgi:hypothetical protein